jgi:alpha-glucosidase
VIGRIARRALALAVLTSCLTSAAATAQVSAVSGDGPFYKKEIGAAGIKVRSSGNAADKALVLAAATIMKMTRRQDVLSNLVKAGVTVAVIARTEVTTDIPEYRSLKGTKSADGRDWDADMRGIGGTAEIPTTSAAEENLLKLPEDRYAGEDILTHEFGHSVYTMGITADERRAVQAAFAAAQITKAWGEPDGPAWTYSMSSVEEYFAEGTQSFFGVGQSGNPSINNGVSNRETMKEADPALERILAAIYEP